MCSDFHIYDSVKIVRMPTLPLTLGLTLGSLDNFGTTASLMRTP